MIRRTEIRFTWIPGIKPVMIPAMTPSRRAMSIGMNIYLFESGCLYCWL